MSNSIIVVIATQFRENYGAHDWDGEGYCPQHWKSKGGDTYFINASADDIANTQWWVDVERSIEHSSAYSEEYIISESVVDLIDFREEDHIVFFCFKYFLHFIINGPLCPFDCQLTCHRDRLGDPLIKVTEPLVTQRTIE